MIDEDNEVAHLRVPPHSREAEQSVLGGLMLDNAAWDKVGDLLTESDFYRHEHRLIYAAIGALISATKPADVITVFERLEQLGKAEDCGGLMYLNSLSASVPSAANIRRYAEIVRERAVLRKLVAASDEIATKAFNPQGENVTDIVDHALTLLGDLQRKGTRKMPRSMDDIMIERADHASDVHERGEEPGWKTGIGALDRMLLGGFKPGKVYTLAARPSVGKSSFAEFLCITQAQAGNPSLYLSQEMGDDEIGDRAISKIGEIHNSRLQTARMNDSEWGRFSEAVHVGSKLPMWVDDQAALTVPEIRVKARYVPGLRLLVLDYLQLCQGSGKKNDTRAGEIGEVSRATKQLAKNLGIAVLQLSQLNRKVEERRPARPIMSDLREAGDIEQDSDVVMFLWPHSKSESGDHAVIGCDIAKNRGGPTGSFGLNFLKPYHRWNESTVDVNAKPDTPSGGSGFE